jgi:DNA-binding SARP family transcriptional activator
VHISDQLLRLLLWTPHSDPPSGWQVDDDGSSWILPTAVDPTHLHFLADTTPAPYPALVTVGHDDTGGQLLLDLEHLGAAQITGEPDEVVAALRTMAVELATSHIGDMRSMWSASGSAETSRIWSASLAVDDLTGILSEIDQKTAVLDNQDVTPLEGRLAPGGDAWAPIVILDPSPEKPEDADRLLAVAHRGRAVCAVVGYPTGGQWRFHLTDGTITIHPLGYTYHRRDLTPTEATGIADLTRAAKDLDGVPEALVAPAPSTPPTQDWESGPDSDDSTANTRVEVTAPATPEVRTLGSVRVDGITERFPEAKSLELVTYLVLHRQGVEPDTLLEALFPGRPPKTDRLNNLAYRARSTLGNSPDGTPYVPYFYGSEPYQISAHLRCDLERFTRHIDSADETEEAESLSHLQAALEIVEGPPFTVKKGYGWAHSEGISTHAIVTIDNAAHRLAALALDRNEPELTTWAARKGLTASWACEECYRNLMRAAIAQHDHTAFEAVYSELNTLLEEEQGPDATDWLEPETVDLYHQHRQRRRNAG